MGRPPTFSDTQILDAATSLIAAHGPRASVAAVAKTIGAPSGSIYYRFPNRDALIAAAWLRAVRRFQARFLDALEHPDPDRAAVGAATHVPRWCGANLDAAILLHRYRVEDIVDGWPDDLAPDRATVNDELYTALRHHARARYGSAAKSRVERTTFALVHIPGAAVRPYLDRRIPPPAWSIEAAAVAALAVLRDGPGPAAN